MNKFSFEYQPFCHVKHKRKLPFTWWSCNVKVMLSIALKKKICILHFNKSQSHLLALTFSTTFNYFCATNHESISYSFPTNSSCLHINCRNFGEFSTFHTIICTLVYADVRIQYAKSWKIIYMYFTFCMELEETTRPNHITWFHRRYMWWHQAEAYRG